MWRVITSSLLIKIICGSCWVLVACVSMELFAFSHFSQQGLHELALHVTPLRASCQYFILHCDYTATYLCKPILSLTWLVWSLCFWVSKIVKGEKWDDIFIIWKVGICIWSIKSCDTDILFGTFSSIYDKISKHQMEIWDEKCINVISYLAPYGTEQLYRFLVLDNLAYWQNHSVFYSLRPSDAYMRRQSNHHWCR